MDTRVAGQLGGFQAAKNMTKEQRIKRATNAVQARESKRLKRVGLVQEQ